MNLFIPLFQDTPMTQYYISLPDPEKARGSEADLSFRAHSAQGFAEELQDALRSTTLFEKWRAKQPDPDAVETRWAAVDPDASVEGKQDDLRINLVVTTTINGDVFKHRMRLLAGHHWELREVR